MPYRTLMTLMVIMQSIGKFKMAVTPENTIRNVGLEVKMAFLGPF